MFTKTVASVCDQFTKNLEVVLKQQDVKVKAAVTEAQILERQLDIVKAKKDSALTEVNKAVTAINNIKKLFGEV